MRDNVCIHIESTGTILGSSDCSDYPESTDKEASHVESFRLPRWRNACLIFANECKNISITGNGKIDCNGDKFVVRNEGDINKKTKGYKFKAREDLMTPPRVVFFTGCTNVKIEGITMTNQPAGWSYWIHDCDFVSFTRCRIIADVNYRNNDGIHINCSRDVTISDCNLICGDDCIIVRANSKSLKENKISERVTVSNCSLTSYSGGIRLGWYNDGVIRNCVFSNIVMTDTSIGINIVLPFLKTAPEGSKEKIGASDVGRESTLIQNISFNNIIMDKISESPVRIKVSKNLAVKINAVENIYFSNIHAKSIFFPDFIGRKENPIKNIVFSGCSFQLISPNEIPNLTLHGGGSLFPDDIKERGNRMRMENVENIVFDSTSFSAN